mmetsp:Transcript_16515/g.37801  ORF Transcript_16515/g.37801 Transcript_16515/m.37801 type:complete len:165 (-) Transcript_16515:846-1340(-)
MLSDRQLLDHFDEPRGMERAAALVAEGRDAEAFRLAAGWLLVRVFVRVFMRVALSLILANRAVAMIPAVRVLVPVIPLLLVAVLVPVLALLLMAVLVSMLAVLLVGVLVVPMFVVAVFVMPMLVLVASLGASRIFAAFFFGFLLLRRLRLLDVVDDLMVLLLLV